MPIRANPRRKKFGVTRENIRASSGSGGHAGGSSRNPLDRLLDESKQSPRRSCGSEYDGEEILRAVSTRGRLYNL